MLIAFSHERLRAAVEDPRWQPGWGFRSRMFTALAAAAVSLAGILAYHFAYSGDRMGPFRPGNAWDENAIEPATWLVSLPGHWLHRTRGLLNNSPVFLVAVAGLFALVRARDRRFLVFAALYSATAVQTASTPDGNSASARPSGSW